MYSWSDPKFEVADMVGKTFVRVEKVNDDIIKFTADNGDQYAFYHDQDCCESVVVKDIVGDLSDLEGSPLIEAEEVTKTGDSEWGSETWTFYKFGTIKGHVNISWEGSSNGYYSESVDKALVKASD